MQKISRERVPELDGIRAIACLLVLWVHLGPASFQPPAILAAGSTGIDLFFVLSGFLISRILLYNRHHGIPLRTFMVKRAARIFPVAYLVSVCLPHGSLRNRRCAQRLYHHGVSLDGRSCVGSDVACGRVIVSLHRERTKPRSPHDSHPSDSRCK